MYQIGWLYITEVTENYFKMFPHKLAYKQFAMVFNMLPKTSVAPYGSLVPIQGR